MQLFSPEDVADIFCYQMVTKPSPLCFLSVQKQGVKSSGAPSSEAQKQDWLWKCGTGWPGRQAENPQMAAWTATAQKESEWGRLCCVSLPPLPETTFSFSLSASRNGIYLAFYTKGNRFGDKVFCFNGKMLKCNCQYRQIKLCDSVK